MTDSTAYHSHYPCNDGSGTPADIAKSTTMTVGSAASTGLFANTGWITTATSVDAGTPQTSGGVFITPQPDFDLVQGDSFLLMFWLKMSAPAGNEKVAGTVFRATTEAGFSFINSGSAGQVEISFSSSVKGESYSVQSVLGEKIMDNEYHHVAVAIDGTTKFCQFFIDGNPQRDADESGSLQKIVDLGGSLKNANDGYYGFGIAGDGGGAEKSFAGQFRDIHTLVFDNGGLPHNLTKIVNWAITNPYQTLTTEVVGV